MRIIRLILRRISWDHFYDEEKEMKKYMMILAALVVAGVPAYVALTAQAEDTAAVEATAEEAAPAVEGEAAVTTEEAAPAVEGEAAPAVEGEAAATEETAAPAEGEAAVEGEAATTEEAPAEEAAH